MLIGPLHRDQDIKILYKFSYWSTHWFTVKLTNQHKLKILAKHYHYRPQTKFAKVMFLQVSVILSTGGACVVARGGCAWLLGGRAWLLRGVRAWLLGGVRGCSGGHAWLLGGGMRGCSRGGMHGCSWGVCVVALGGMCGCSQGGACMVAPGGMCGFFDEIRSMSWRYASYWNAYLLGNKSTQIKLLMEFPVKLTQLAQKKEKRKKEYNPSPSYCGWLWKAGYERKLADLEENVLCPPPPFFKFDLITPRSTSGHDKWLQHF